MLKLCKTAVEFVWDSVGLPDVPAVSCPACVLGLSLAGIPGESLALGQEEQSQREWQWKTVRWRGCGDGGVKGDSGQWPLSPISPLVFLSAEPSTTAALVQIFVGEVNWQIFLYAYGSWCCVTHLKYTVTLPKSKWILEVIATLSKFHFDVTCIHVQSPSSNGSVADGYEKCLQNMSRHQMPLGTEVPLQMVQLINNNWLCSNISRFLRGWWIHPIPCDSHQD